MSPERDTASLLQALKQVMKNQGVTYGDAARHLELSLPTVKRLFISGEMPLSRLLKLTHWLGLSLTELVALAETKPKGNTRLNRGQEEFFAENPMVLAYFYALKGGQVTPAEIAEHYGLTPRSTRFYLRALEEQGLIRLLADDKVKMVAERGLEWDDGGPLGRAVTQKAVGSFVHHAFEAIGKSRSLQMRNCGWRLSEAEFSELKGTVDGLLEKFRHTSHLNALSRNAATRYVNVLWIADEWDYPMYEDIRNI
jgi:DNA-binding transcriptional ArsR family regulator